jgi:hypothetical protein
MRSYPTEGDGMKRKLVAGAVAGLAVAGGGAAAVAATQTGSPQEESKAVVEDAAKQLGVQPTELSNALKQALKNRIDAAVAAGRLTEEQGKELKDRVDAEEFPLLGAGLRGGHHGPGGPFGRGLDAAAEYLGTTEEALREQLRDGTTLAGAAKKAGKSVDGLVDALVADAKEKLDAAQAAGRITAAQKQEKLHDLREHVTALVNGERPEGGPRAFGNERRGPWS